MEVSRLVKMCLAYFVPAFVAPTSNSPVSSFPLPVSADPPRTVPWFVELVPALADFFPWPREAVRVGVVCSFFVVYYPVEEEEKWTLGMTSSMRREMVEQMELHRDWQRRAVVKA